MESSWKINNHHRTDGQRQSAGEVAERKPDCSSVCAPRPWARIKQCQCEGLELPWTWIPSKYLTNHWWGKQEPQKHPLFKKRSFLKSKEDTTIKQALSQKPICFYNCPLHCCHLFRRDTLSGELADDETQSKRENQMIRYPSFQTASDVAVKERLALNVRPVEEDDVLRSLTRKIAVLRLRAEDYMRRKALKNIFNIWLKSQQWKLAADLSLNYGRH